MVFEELEDSEDDVVDVAEAGGLALFGVVEAAGPVDGDVVAVVELDGAADGAAGVGLAEAVEPVEDGAVLADVESLERADLVLLRLGGDGAEEGDVVVGVEAAEVPVAGGVRLEHLHLVEEAVVGEQRVGHADAVRLHRVALAVVVVADLRVVEVADAALRAIRAGGGQGVAAAAGRDVHPVAREALLLFSVCVCLGLWVSPLDSRRRLSLESLGAESRGRRDEGSSGEVRYGRFPASHSEARTSRWITEKFSTDRRLRPITACMQGCPNLPGQKFSSQLRSFDWLTKLWLPMES